VVGESFLWSSAVLVPPKTTGWMSHTMTTRVRPSGRYITTCAFVAASGFNEVTEFGHLSSQPVGLVPDEEYQRVILDSVGDGTFCGYGDRSAALYSDP
jgi:hypothetical protein